MTLELLLHILTIIGACLGGAVLIWMLAVLPLIRMKKQIAINDHLQAENQRQKEQIAELRRSAMERPVETGGIVLADRDERFRQGLEELQSAFDRTCETGALLDSVAEGKLQRAFDSDLTVTRIDLSAEIRSEREDGENNIYHVTLKDCTCPDFRIRQKPCKHMVHLAYRLGLLQLNRSDCQNHYQYSVENIAKLSAVSDALQKEIQNQRQTLKNEKNS